MCKVASAKFLKLFNRSALIMRILHTERLRATSRTALDTSRESETIAARAGIGA